MNHLRHSKIFIAASLDEVWAAKLLATSLKKLGFKITSSWHDSYNAEAAENPNTQRMMSVVNVLDMDEATMLILLKKRPSTTGGLHFEHGYAVNADKFVVLVGEPENIYEQAVFLRFEDVDSLLEMFRTMAASR